MSLEALQVVSVPVSDQAAAKRFYVEVLGFEVVRDIDAPHALIAHPSNAASWERQLSKSAGPAADARVRRVLPPISLCKRKGDDT